MLRFPIHLHACAFQILRNKLLKLRNKLLKPGFPSIRRGISSLSCGLPSVNPSIPTADRLFSLVFRISAAKEARKCAGYKRTFKIRLMKLTKITELAFGILSA
jgi:hypothetical protein